MILIDGVILDSDKMDEVITSLNKRIIKTMQKPLLDKMTVVEACQRLSEKIEAGEFRHILAELAANENITAEQIAMAVQLLKKESLLYKLETELGEDYKKTVTYTPMYREDRIHRSYMPLGVLFHIAAGNIDALPAYSVIEGLLAGNINILKLPAADNGLTIKLLWELIRIEPALAEYIYVFDIPSHDIARMKKMAKCADGIVVWGGDTAVSAVRGLASPNTKIIEWGHKLSFAYITEKGRSKKELKSLAHHILSTGQLLCSSCQGIFIDTDRMQVAADFCSEFIKVLEEAAKSYPEPDIGLQAQITLNLYQQELLICTASGLPQKHIYKGKNCSIILSADRKLEASYTCGNCWVKPLPRKYIIRSLHRYKGYLQTAGLICAPEEYEELSFALLRAGVTRITPAGEMSRMLCGESHDGEYPLRRYSRIIEF